MDLVARFQRQSEQLAESGPGASVEFLFAQLEPESAQYLRLCAIPHQFSSPVLRVLVPGLSPEDADEQCKQFSELPVVTFNQDGMALHDKARHHLFQQWVTPPVNEEFKGASARLAEYFKQAADTGGEDQRKNYSFQRIFHLIGAEPDKGFDEFQTRCRELRRQFRLNDCEHLIKLVHEYDSILSPEQKLWLSYHEGKLAADRCQWEQSEQLFKQILKSDCPAPVLCALAYYRLGMLRQEKRDFFGAISNYKKALEEALRRPHSEGYRYRILHDLGVAYRDAGQLDRAEEVLKESIAMAEELKNISGVALGCNSLGTLYRLRGDTKRAIDLYNKSLECLADSGDTFRPAQVYNNLGIVYTELADWKKSREFFERSLEITRREGDALGQAKTLNNLVRVYQNLRQKERAVEAAEEAIRLFTEMREDYSAALSKRDLGRLYRRMKKRDLAHQALTEASDAFDKCGEGIEAGRTRAERDTARNKPRLPWVLLIFLAALFALFIFILHHMDRVPY
jgi:tetratricopeptide (TPR) repeat protein